jgi:alpha-L-fucosidase
MTNQAWIGENPIGDWYYAPGYTYEAVSLVRSLVEYISRGGNYACAVPVDPEGRLEPQCVAMLKDMGDWMKVNSEGVYGSRAWDVWGEGSVVMPNGRLGPEQVRTPYTAKDIRFTAKDGLVYAWLMAWPEDGKVIIRSLADGAGKITGVTLLGSPEKLDWQQMTEGLVVDLPTQKPCRFAYCLKLAGDSLKAVPSQSHKR